MISRYRNFFYSSTRGGDPEFYTTDARPIPYKGFLIYRRLPNCFDIVKDGICVGQYAGLSGARGVIDEPTEWFREKLDKAFPRLLVKRIRK